MNKNDTYTSMYAISIKLDHDMCEGLKEEFGKEFIAFKNDEYGIGAFASEDGEFGIYGDTEIRRMAISAYCDNHEEQIEDMLTSATSMNELCGALSKIVAEFIMDVLRTVNAAYYVSKLI